MGAAARTPSWTSGVGPRGASRTTGRGRVGDNGWVAATVSDFPVRLRRGFLLAAILGVPIVLTGIAAMFTPTLWAGSIMIAALVAAFVLAGRVVPESRCWLVAAAGAAGLSAILVLIWTPMAVLAAHGERLPAVVVGVQVAPGKHDLYCYSLHRTDGTPISGDLIETADIYSIGEQLEVIVDRRGDIDPVAASALDGSRPTGTAAVVCVVVAVALSVLTGAGHTWSLGLGYRPRH